jgi:conjugative transfer region protein TrbK
MLARGRFSAKELDEQVRTLRFLAVATVGVGLMILAAWLVGIDDGQEGVVERSSVIAPAPVDPLRAELIRCNGIGQAALEDAGCRAAWAENRRRFFGTPNRQPPSVNEPRAAAPIAPPPEAAR